MPEGQGGSGRRTVSLFCVTRSNTRRRFPEASSSGCMHHPVVSKSILRAWLTRLEAWGLSQRPGIPSASRSRGSHLACPRRSRLRVRGGIENNAQRVGARVIGGFHGCSLQYTYSQLPLRINYGHRGGTWGHHHLAALNVLARLVQPISGPRRYEWCACCFPHQYVAERHRCA